ncbi:MAG: hypothetical protein AB1645_03985 [Bacillota bacterium]
MRSARGLWRAFGILLERAGSLQDSSETDRREKEEDIIDSFAEMVSRQGFGTAGIFMAESAKPLSYLFAQGLHFLTPHFGFILGEQRVANAASLLENRRNLERFIRRIELLEARGAPAGQTATGRSRQEETGRSGQEATGRSGQEATGRSGQEATGRAGQEETGRAGPNSSAR